MNEAVITGEIPPFSHQTSDVLMMTGATENHAYASFNCLYSMVLADPYASYAYLDGGMGSDIRAKLYAHFDTILEIQRKMASTGVLSYRRLNWASLPKWWYIEENPMQRGGYAFKVIPYLDVFYEWQGIFYWLDAGDLIREGISRELTMVRHYGLYSPSSAGNVGIWVHNKTQQFLVDNGLFQHFVPSKSPMISSGVLIMDYRNATIRNSFVPTFQMCAYTRKCIAPIESSLNNHRFDQAVVSLLISYYGVPFSGSKYYRYHPVLRRDGGNKESFLLPTLHNLLLKIQDAYSIRFNNSYYETRNITYTKQVFKYISRPLDKEWP